MRDRFRSGAARVVVPGVPHRLELVASLLKDAGQPMEVRQRAAAAILYADEQRDAIPDGLGAVGLLDDDYALQLTLEQFDDQRGERTHWTERISSLWDDLPFLRGMRLRRDGDPIATNWLDRISSFLCYNHALERSRDPLILVQPSVACSPVHTLVSLLGLLVLDGLTSSSSPFGSLRVGRIYEIDGQFRVRYGGVLEGPPAPGWLRLEFRDQARYTPPGLAARMVPSDSRRLSSGKSFSSYDSEPIQKFFEWEEAIGTASLRSRILLVTSRERATELLAGITSNGVSLLNDGFVKFVRAQPTEELARSGQILVTPTLERSRTLLSEPLMKAHAIVVDGYQRLRRGRYALPFLQMQPSAPPIIVWSARGYFPERVPGWLPEHRTLHVEPDDLPSILELDDSPDGDQAPGRASLREAANTSGPETFLVTTPEEERQLLTLIDELLDSVVASSLPTYWRYRLLSAVTTLRALISATPAQWAYIRSYASNAKDAIEQEWNRPGPVRTRSFGPLRRLLDDLVSKIQLVPSNLNSKARALVDLLGDERNGKGWRLVCDRPEQIGASGRMLRAESIREVKPTRVRDLEVCQDCLVVGWRNLSLGRRLQAHTPRRLVALVDETEARKWSRLTARSRQLAGRSVLDALGNRVRSRPPTVTSHRSPEAGHSEDELGWSDPGLESTPGPARVECSVIWLADESEGKVLPRHSRVLVQAGDDLREVPAARIAAGDRVVLGIGREQWSPAAEFTQAVVEAVGASSPELIDDAREWRRALSTVGKTRSWSTAQLQTRLAQVGVKRTMQTLEGWLRLDQAEPIGPQHLSRELEAMWPLIGAHSRRARSQVEEACQRLRSLRWEAGRALLELWGGGSANLGLEATHLDGIMERLQESVQGYEVEEVRLGAVPAGLLGCWVDGDFAELYCGDAENGGPESGQA